MSRALVIKYFQMNQHSPTDSEVRMLMDDQGVFINNADLQNAYRSFAGANGIFLPDDILYVPGIDFVEVWGAGGAILKVNLPPVSNYEVSRIA